MDDPAEPTQLHPEQHIEMRLVMRAELERIAAALGLGFGHGRVRLLLEFQEGHLKWFEPSFVRVPASRLDEFAAGE